MCSSSVAIMRIGSAPDIIAHADCTNSHLYISLICGEYSGGRPEPWGFGVHKFDARLPAV